MKGSVHFTVHIISFANQKGGVGKTTSALSCASSLGTLGKRVLLIDLDPQANSTSSLGIAKNGLKYSIYDVFTGKADDISDAIIETKYKNLSIIPSNMMLASIEAELTTEGGRESYLKRILSGLSERDLFDYVIIDCPPSLGMITINALVASTGLIIPTQCEYFALEGLTQLMMTVKAIKARYNKNLVITGILVTMFTPRFKLSKEVLNELESYYFGMIFDQKISRSISLSESSSYAEPINYYSKYSKSSLEYQKVAREIVERTEGII
ncbi:MAG: ParA family protein [Clostridia bacterium]|nr:ParA family protein [Clostridia bacterium]